MSYVIKRFKPAQLLSVHQILTASRGRQASHFYPDYCPDPVPKTEEEKIKAAKKYNLLPEEYECFEENEGHGDYPKLPIESVDSRDPWYPWDNQELRKNFNEPVSVRIMNYLPEMQTTVEPKISHKKGVLYFLSLFAGCLVFIYLVDQIKLVHPACEKQYPMPGVTHYTFELDYDEAARRALKKKITCYDFDGNVVE